MICGSGGSKSRLAKAAGSQMRDEQLHAVVAQSAFGSQNVQSTINTSVSEHVWKLRCRKSARRCGATHVSRSRPLLDVQMSFRVAGARDCAPCHTLSKVSKT